MKQVIFLIIGMNLFFCKDAKAGSPVDTIDYWHVYYNAKKIKEYNDFTSGKIIIEQKKINPKDSIKVLVYRDTHCSECKTSLSILVRKDTRVLLVQGKDNGKALSFSLQDLLNYKRARGVNEFDIIYFNERNVADDRKKKLFSIQLNE